MKTKEIIQQYKLQKTYLEHVYTFMLMNYTMKEIYDAMRALRFVVSEDQIAFYHDYIKDHEGETLNEINDAMWMLLWEMDPPQLPIEEEIRPIEPEYRPVQVFASKMLFRYFVTCRMEMLQSMIESCPERFKEKGWEKFFVEIGFDSEYIFIMYNILTDKNNDGKSLAELSEKAYRVLYVGKKRIYNNIDGTGKMYSCDLLDIRYLQERCENWSDRTLKRWLSDIETEEQNRRGRQNND